MGTGVDFISFLDDDTSMNILMYLEDPSDLVRVSTVSHCWHSFVVENGLCKRLCSKMFPQLSSIDHVTESATVSEEAPAISGRKLVGQCDEEMEHRAYAFLARGCVAFPFRECIADALYASSTDNYPEESIQNTLEPMARVAGRPSYWSSKGESNPMVPETLVYKLADVCIITKVSIQPFQAYFQFGHPIYSSKHVRFRVGHPTAPLDDPMHETCDICAQLDYTWTYTSPEFPMVQENSLQEYLLPEPVLCIGCFLQVELLGRVQRQALDDRFYLCICHVQAMGRLLSPLFEVGTSEREGKLMLKVNSYAHPEEITEEAASRSRSRSSPLLLDCVTEFIVTATASGSTTIWNSPEDDEESDPDDEF